MTRQDLLTAPDDSQARLANLSDLAQRLLERARACGADQCEVNCNEDAGLAVNVRMGEVETVEATRDRGVSVTVYFGSRKGSASSADLRDESLTATVTQACAIARHTEEDPCAGLADAALMATSLREFDGWHPAPFDADRAIDVALACEAAGRDVDARIGNSDGASMNANASLSVYANSHGFLGAERSTSWSIGCALIAGEGEAMQRDGWYSVALAQPDLETPEAIGRKAAQRALARLQPRQLPTGQVPVLFSAEMARSLIGSFLGAVSGGALYRRASLLLDSAGTQVFPDWFGRRGHPQIDAGGRRHRPALRAGELFGAQAGAGDDRQRRRRAQPYRESQYRRSGVADEGDGTWPAGDGADGAGRESDYRRLLARRRRVLGGARRDRLAGGRHHHRRQPQGDVRRHRGRGQRHRSAFARAHRRDPDRQDDGGRHRLTHAFDGAYPGQCGSAVDEWAARGR